MLQNVDDSILYLQNSSSMYPYMRHLAVLLRTNSLCMQFLKPKSYISLILQG